ncbi:hypothetical protein RM533_07130 [Croceicoccus sp. F390]|uniref:Uncharacterized protein n=1 Tax=Croceicoccus esteveae TaxID=3075597 RepID=A0ABU2ZHX0_9SPHN|nr:hypothetical protein [Croceicoccus sp. F390]MDT0575956.1 hypothetical protein [Croceicoccus sp. F390]
MAKHTRAVECLELPGSAGPTHENRRQALQQVPAHARAVALLSA